MAYTLSLYVYIHEAFIILSCYLNCGSFEVGIFEKEFFLEFWKTLRCLWFYGTKTYHKVLAHPSRPLAVRVDTFRGFLHTASPWLVAAGLFPEGVLFVFQRVYDQANLH